ncbi:MAG: acyltransferase family protein [Bacilli bacterium]|nr:acyltransferase family protein [Bacilli bacterium]
MSEVKVRQSNFELMRIISMLMIIIWHIFYYGIDRNLTASNIRVFYDFFSAVFAIHVNSFVLLSGYFQCESKFKMSKLLKLNDSIIFYKILIFIIFIFLGIATTDLITVVRNVVPFDLENYWFMRVYIIMYIFSPFYNMFLDKLSKADHKKILFVMFLLFSVLSTLTKQEATMDATVNGGYSIVSFTFLYFVGAYFRKYPIKESYFGKKFSFEMRKLIFIFLFFILVIFNFSIHITSIKLLEQGGFMAYFGNILYIGFLKYDNPIVVLQAISYFMIFYHMKFSNKIVNLLSSTAFGAYLIHDNLFMRRNLYQIFNFPLFITSRRIFIKIFAVAIIIYLACFIIDITRQYLFKFISETKVAKWWRRKYRGYLSDLGFNINW